MNDISDIQRLSKINEDLNDIERVLTKHEELDNSIKYQTEQLINFNKRFDKLDNKLDVLREDPKNNSKEIQNKIDSLDNEISKQESILLEQLTKNNSRIEQKIMDLTNKVNNLGNVPPISENNLEELKQNNDSQYKDILKMVNNINNRINSIDILKKNKFVKIEDINKIKDDLQLSIKDVIKDNDDSKITKEDLTNMLDKFKIDFDSKLSELNSSINKEISKNKTQIKTEFKNLRSNQDTLKQTLNNGTDKCDLIQGKRKLSEKQKKIASECLKQNKTIIDLNFSKEVGKHIKERKRMSQRYTKKILKEVSSIEKKISKRNIMLSNLLNKI